ncbi:MAG: hypothetical protein ACTSX9_08850 [Candidatus Njordarchaeales archaeon]
MNEALIYIIVGLLSLISALVINSISGKILSKLLQRENAQRKQIIEDITSLKHITSALDLVNIFIGRGEYREAFNATLRIIKSSLQKYFKKEKISFRELKYLVTNIRNEKLAKLFKDFERAIIKHKKGEKLSKSDVKKALAFTRELLNVIYSNQTI